MHLHEVKSSLGRAVFLHRLVGVQLFISGGGEKKRKEAPQFAAPPAVEKFKLRSEGDSERRVAAFSVEVTLEKKRNT